MVSVTNIQNWLLHLDCVSNILKKPTFYFDFKRPELTLQIEKNHFDLNFQGQEADFQLEGAYYKKIVALEDLNVGFDDENDRKSE